MSSAGKPGVQLRAISDRDEALWAMRSIASQMPVTFDGGVEWTGLEGYCAECEHAIPPDDLRGSVVRLSPSVVAVDAVGVCRPCRLMTPFFWRLHADMRVTGPTASGWGEWRAHPSIFDRLTRWWTFLMHRQSRT